MNLQWIIHGLLIVQKAGDKRPWYTIYVVCFVCFVLLISLMCIENAIAYDVFAHFIHNIYSTIEWLIYIGGTLIFITTMGSNI